MRRWCVAAAVGSILGLAGGRGSPSFAPAAFPVLAAPTAEAATTSPATQPDSAERVLATPVRPSTEPAVRFPRFSNLAPGEGDAVLRFMEKNSPARLAFIRALPDGPRRSAMAAGAVQDYHAYERARTDEDLSRTILTRLKLEDDLFALATKLRSAPPDQQKQLSDELRQKVGQWTDATFGERQQRIDRLQRTLEGQQRNLSDDKARRDVIVNDRFKEVMRNIHLASSRPSTQPAATTRP